MVRACKAPLRSSPSILTAMTWLLLSGCGGSQGVLAPNYYGDARAFQTLLHEQVPRTASVHDVPAFLPPSSAPRTAADYDTGQPRPYTLAEVICLALENSEVVRAISGPGMTGAQTTIYDPSITETLVQAALAAFDASVATSMLWERRDSPPDVSFQGLLDQPQQLDLANFRSSIIKPFTTGGQGRISLNSDYFFETLPPGPVDDVAQHNPRLEFGLSQPLLRGSGVTVNRAPIVIARAQTDQSLWDFRAALIRLIRDVESAYWQLHAAQVSLRGIDAVIPLAEEIVRIQEERLKVRVAIEADTAQAQANLELFRRRRIQAIAALLEQAATLRNLLGLPVNDGYNLITADAPSSARLSLDWDTLLRRAEQSRPDVMRQRLAVRIAKLNVMRANNATLPGLDGQALWRLNGAGQDLGDALDVLTDNQFTDWRLGFSLDLPLYNDRAAADARAAQLTLARERALLRQSLHTASHELAAAVRDLDGFYLQYQAARRRTEQADRWRTGSRARFENPTADNNVLLTLQTYLQALDAWATANAEAAQLLAQYNTAIARLAEADGTLLARHNLVLQDGPYAGVHLGSAHHAEEGRGEDGNGRPVDQATRLRRIHGLSTASPG